MRVRMRKRTWLVTGVVTVTLVGGVGLWWALQDDGEAAVASPTTTTVASSTMKDTVSASGTIAAASSADLSFEVGGTVSAVRVAEGDTVVKGQVIARVDPTLLDAAVTAAASTYEAAQAQYSEDTDADVSDTQLAADQSQVVAAQASLEEARADRENAVLRSTFAGTVTSLDLAVGDVVGGGSQTSSSGGTTEAGGAGSAGSSATDTGDDSSSEGTVTVVSTDRFVMDATVAGADVESLREGLQAEITVSGLEETVYGTVEEVGLVAETGSSGAAVFPVTIAVTGAPDGLYAGTSAEASVVVKQTEDVLTVPSAALQSDEDGVFVEKVTEAGTVRTSVETGTVYGAQTEVLSGLAEGDEVEVTGLAGRPGGAGGAGGAGSGDGDRPGMQGETFTGGDMPQPSGGFGGGFGGDTGGAR